ncbi:MAG: hypothetical protein ACREYF_21115 [Gammaproteobacteria bacterium]
MSNFTIGQTVKIPCEVQRGAFPTELLVTFDTAEGPVSGFVRKEGVEGEGHEGFIRATVTAVSSDTLTVMVQGSFFTTTGLAYLRRDWANSHVHPAHA